MNSYRRGLRNGVLVNPKLFILEKVNLAPPTIGWTNLVKLIKNLYYLVRVVTQILVGQHLNSKSNFTTLRLVHLHNLGYIFIPHKKPNTKKWVILSAKLWNHFIATKIILRGNISEVNKERDLYLYAIMEDIKFDVGEVIETYIWINTIEKHNLRHSALIFELCKKAWVQFTTQEERIIPLVEITVNHICHIENN